MRQTLLALLAVMPVAGRALAQDKPGAAHNGVIKPGANVDPGMKVVPPRTPTTMPVIQPHGAGRGHQRRVVVVPK